jgi:hypothetical protein
MTVCPCHKGNLWELLSGRGDLDSLSQPQPPRVVEGPLQAKHSSNTAVAVGCREQISLPCLPCAQRLHSTILDFTARLSCPFGRSIMALTLRGLVKHRHPIRFGSSEPGPFHLIGTPINDASTRRRKRTSTAIPLYSNRVPASVCISALHKTHASPDAKYKAHPAGPIYWSVSTAM